MSKDPQVEVLGPEEGAEQEFPLLRIPVPLEKLKDLFDGLAKVQETAMLWAEKTVIDSPKTRDEARALLQNIRSTAKKIDEKRLLVQQPVKDYITELKTICDEAAKPLHDAADTLARKVEAYAAECRRREEEEKQKVLAAQRAEQQRVEAERREREAQEKKLRDEELARVEAARVKALEEAKAKAPEQQGELAEGEVPNDDAEQAALNAMNAEMARIERERADREKAEADRKAEEDSRLDRARQEMASGMAQASGHGKTKGVKDVWVIEVVDETKIPPQFKTYDPKKAKAFLTAGLTTESDPLKIITGLRCYKAISATGR